MCFVFINIYCNSFLKKYLHLSFLKTLISQIFISLVSEFFIFLYWLSVYEYITIFVRRWYFSFFVICCSGCKKIPFYSINENLTNFLFYNYFGFYLAFANIYFSFIVFTQRVIFTKLVIFARFYWWWMNE